MSIQIGGKGSWATGSIRVEGDTLVINGVHFHTTPGEIDTGGLNLVFVNSMSDHHSGVSFQVHGGSSLVQDNVFGAVVPRPKKKPWWRFW